MSVEVLLLRFRAFWASSCWPKTHLHHCRLPGRSLLPPAATHRFTQAEKESLRDIVYTYERQAYRTSENEIARIGVNWLVEDYRENGKRSVLHRILKALKE